MTNRTLDEEALCPGSELATNPSLTVIDFSGSEGYTHVTSQLGDSRVKIQVFLLPISVWPAAGRGVLSGFWDSLGLVESHFPSELCKRGHCTGGYRGLVLLPSLSVCIFLCPCFFKLFYHYTLLINGLPGHRDYEPVCLLLFFFPTLFSSICQIAYVHVYPSFSLYF